MPTLKTLQERLAEHFKILAEQLEDEEHSDEWLDVFEEAGKLVNRILEMEDEEEGGEE